MNALLNEKPSYNPRHQERLMEEIWAHEYDWQWLVRFMFPWGDPVKPLAHFDGPRNWQDDLFGQISDHRRTAARLLPVYRQHKAEHAKLLVMRKTAQQEGVPLFELDGMIGDQKAAMARHAPPVFTWSCRSCHGSGKDAFLSMFAVIFLSVCRGATYITTANTEPQLLSKTLPEVAKWFRLSINAHFWDVETLVVRPAPWYRKHLENQLSIDCKYHYAQGLTWNEHNPEAFTGQHNWNGTAFAKSECSGIADSIWDAIDGAWTEPIIDRYDLNVGNPWRTTGRFYESHHKLAHMYRRTHLSHRDVEDMDPKFAERIAEKHGVGSTQYRVQADGEFPLDGDERFIKPETVQGALARDLVVDAGAPLVIGIDVARMGPDSSALFPRKGLDLRSYPPITFHKRDLAWLTDACERVIIRYLSEGLQRVFIDGIGLGAGVGDHLAQRFRQAGHPQLIVVIDSNNAAEDDGQFANAATEWWARMRTALKLSALGPHDRFLADVGERKELQDKKGRVRLETKDEMRDRGLQSPDVADACALTYFAEVPRTDYGAGRAGNRPTHAAGLNPRPGGYARDHQDRDPQGRPTRADGLRPNRRR